MSKSDNPEIDRPYRILWANCYCLLDTSSGASISMRSILKQLTQRGLEVRALGATIFDSAHGMSLFKKRLSGEPKNRKRIAEIKDGAVLHTTVRTRKINRGLMTASEQHMWYFEYLRILDDFKPDLVMMYGGNPLDLLATHEAQRRGVPVAAYLVNGSYAGTNWCRDVDLILTDSEATRRRYLEKDGFDLQVIGQFISPKDVVSNDAARDRVLFINPALPKGAAVVAAIAALLEQTRPDIRFEVVESRGDWKRASRIAKRGLRGVSFGQENITLTPNTSDIRPIFARAKVVLMPSLWWESGGRVAVEALLNGLPVIATNNGGLPEMLDGGGVLIDLPEYCHVAPYSKLPPREMLEEIATLIERLHDDNDFYESFAARTREVAAQNHDIEKNTNRLIAILKPLLSLHAGDGDFAAKLRDMHKQGNLIRAALNQSTEKPDASIERI